MNDIKKAENMIFIGGAPRSGTTLIQRIVASHSCVYGGPEFDLIPKIIELRQSFLSSVDNGRINKYLSKDEVNDLFSNFIASTFGYKLRKVFGKTHISEKTPANVMVFSELSEILPGAHLVFVLRDPRAIVASMLQVGKRYKEEGITPPFFTRNVRAAVSLINDYWVAGHDALNKCKNVHLVYYEEIVENPQQAIMKLTTQLGLEFEPEMLNVAEYDLPEFKSQEHLWYSREKLGAPISNESLESWRTHLSPYESFIIQKRIARFHTTTLYHLESPGSSLANIFETAAFLIWTIRYRLVKQLVHIGKNVYKKIGIA